LAAMKAWAKVIRLALQRLGGLVLM
jgi:hypothetical protein